VDTGRLKKLVLVILVPVFAVAAMFFVQHYRAPARGENVVRAIASFACPIVVPVFVWLAYRTWNRQFRRELPAWRNGLGLASIVVLSLNWLSALFLLLAPAEPRISSKFFSIELIATILYTALAAAILAIALKGAARIYLIAAALLIWANVQAGISF